jgi:LemA protein
VAWLIFGGVVLLLLLWMASLYNGLVQQRQQTRNAWSQIDVQLKRRHDLIPNLVETAKGYMKHEQSTLEAVVRARQAAVSAGSVAEQGRAEGQLSAMLRQLFAVAEAYPELKANQNMLQVQEELTSTENRIGFARQHYNDAVAAYNTKIESVPTNIIANAFGFKAAEYFELEDKAERSPVKVQF